MTNLDTSLPPLTMAASPSPYAAIFVSSGGLCFGALNNIWNGASMPVQPFPTDARPRTSGTVIRQPIEYNIVARNGTWNAFRLIDLERSQVAAWFLAHSDVDPQAELDKILRVSGSPYELDSGSHSNDDKTARQGVFVINRYDWGYYDKRSLDEVGVAEELERDAGTEHTVFEAAGLVDLAVARPMVLQWKVQRSSERLWSEGGAWLHIPNSEYMFGRFGFDDDRVAARSFLFFTTYTDFTQTAFEGLEQTLRKKETPKERFERLLQEGFDFSGLEELNKISQPLREPGVVQFFPPRPPLTDCFGPYCQSDHVLRAQDIISILRSRELEAMSTRGGHGMTSSHTDTPISEFIEPWAESVYDVLNEMVLSYLQRTVIPHIGNRGVSAAAKLLFPCHTLEDRDSQLDVLCYRHFTQPDALQIPNFDSAYVSGRIKSFLSRFGDASVMFEDECVAGITKVVAYLLAEILELANRHARWGNVEWAKIMPSDIRMVVYSEFDIRNYLQFARVYWEGRDPSPSSE